MEIGNDSQKSRLNLFWLLSALATSVYLFVCGDLMTVPGNDPRTDSFPVSFAALLLAVALLTGTWRVSETEAPISIWPGPIVATILVLELVIAVTQAISEIRWL
jgi:hypothetical protein